MLRDLLFFFSDKRGQLGNTAVPLQKEFILQRNVKCVEPIPDRMRLGLVATGNGIEDILDLAAQYTVLIIRVLVDRDCAADRVHGADGRFGLVDRAFAILQQGAAFDTADGLEPYDGDAGILPNVALAVRVYESRGKHVHCLRGVAQVSGREQDVFAVDAAFTAFRAMKPEGAVEVDLPGVVVVDYFFQSGIHRITSDCIKLRGTDVRRLSFVLWDISLSWCWCMSSASVKGDYLEADRVAVIEDA